MDNISSSFKILTISEIKEIRLNFGCNPFLSRKQIKYFQNPQNINQLKNNRDQT
jgi:hypothetical protein